MLAQRLLGVLGAVVLLGGVAAVGLRSPESDGEPAEGQLAAFDSALASPWEEVARLRPDALGRGAVAALDTQGDTVFLLQRHQWLYIVNGVPSARFGATERGAPNWIASGVGLVAVPGGVVILDGGRQILARWSLDGTRGSEVDLRIREGRAAFHEALAGDGTGRAYVTTRVLRDDGGIRWVVVRHDLAGRELTEPDTIRFIQSAGDAAAYDTPLLAATLDGVVTMVTSNSWHVLRAPPEGELAALTVRTDAPRWAVPDSVRRGIARVLEQLPPEQRAAVALPPTFPPVRAITAARDGGLLVVSAAGIATTHAELLDATARPLGRLWEEPEEHPVYAARGSLFRLRELADETILERQRLRPRTP